MFTLCIIGCSPIFTVQYFQRFLDKVSCEFWHFDNFNDLCLPMALSNADLVILCQPLENKFFPSYDELKKISYKSVPTILINTVSMPCTHAAKSNLSHQLKYSKTCGLKFYLVDAKSHEVVKIHQQNGSFKPKKLHKSKSLFKLLESLVLETRV